jgi:Family of unknown function (DUF6152)
MKTLGIRALAGVVLAGLTLAVPRVFAHHSGAGFNSDEVREFRAVVKEFQFQNPHTWIQVLVTDEDGQQQEWSVEWGSPNALARRGVRPSTFPPGAEVTMRIHPMANGSPAGGFVGAKFSDGTTIGDWED